MIEHLWRRSIPQDGVWKCIRCGIEIFWIPDGDQFTPLDDPFYDRRPFPHESGPVVSVLDGAYMNVSVLDGAYMNGYDAWEAPCGAPRDCGLLIVQKIMES